MRARLFVLFVTLTLAGCSNVQLTALNRIAPTPNGVERVANDVSYGEHPQQRFDLYAPRDAEDLPVLVFVHGGSWTDGSHDAYGFAGRRFAGRGYLTAVIGYRLVPEGAYPAFMQDTAAAIAKTRALAADHGGDPARLFLVGHSAGAYNVVQVVLNERFLEEQGLSADDLEGVAALSGPFDFLPLPQEGVLADAFGTATDLPATQPINHVRADAPPMLLIHGDADETVLPAESRLLARGLEEAGAAVQLVILPGANHIDPLLSLAFDGDLAVTDTVDAFFRSIAGDR